MKPTLKIKNYLFNDLKINFFNIETGKEALINMTNQNFVKNVFINSEGKNLM